MCHLAGLGFADDYGPHRQERRGSARPVRATSTSMLTEGSDGEADLAHFGSPAALSGVSEFPMRVKCATLAWHTLRSALDG